ATAGSRPRPSGLIPAARTARRRTPRDLRSPSGSWRSSPRHLDVCRVPVLAGFTVPSCAAPDGETVQPHGTLSDTATPASGRLVGLRTVARTVNVPRGRSSEKPSPVRRKSLHPEDDGASPSAGCGTEVPARDRRASPHETRTVPAWVPWSSSATWQSKLSETGMVDAGSGLRISPHRRLSYVHAPGSVAGALGLAIAVASGQQLDFDVYRMGAAHVMGQDLYGVRLARSRLPFTY